MSVSSEVVQIFLDRIEALAVENAQLKETNEANKEVIANFELEKAVVDSRYALYERDLEESKRRIESLLTISENLRAAIGQPIMEIKWIGINNLSLKQRDTFPKIAFIKFIREYDVLDSSQKMGLKEAKDLAEAGGKLRLPANMRGAYDELIAPNK